MEGKLSPFEKIIDIIALLVLIAAIAARSILGVKDTGVLVILAFMGILVYVVFFVCAFFPADWRMTEAEKKKIKDMEAYQSKYRKICVFLNLGITIISSGLIFFLS